MKRREFMQELVLKLKKHQIEQPVLKVRMIVSYLLKCSKECLILKEEEEITGAEQEVCNKAIQDLIKGVPVQYITNYQEFMKLPFYVDEQVLIPRPDTEILVEEVLKSSITKNMSALDMCTGSGAIAISIAKYANIQEIVAVDISQKALQIAKKNAEKNGVNHKIKFIKSNLFEGISEMEFDIIVSNPPYISKRELKELAIEVKKEPMIALDGGKDGLIFYRKIADQVEKYLKQNGMLFLEIGYTQKESVIAILEEKKCFSKIESIQDLAGNERVIIARKAG